MAKSISFIHAADLHLDSPFKGLTDIPESIFPSVRNSTFHALDKLVVTAIHRRVDFVLLAGDLFDNENQSLKAQVALREAFEKLKAHHINVYLSYGNHDFINGNIHPIVYPDNVFIFPSENISSFVFTRDQEELASIYGFSYENRSVLVNKSKEFSIDDPSIPYHIAMLHGAVNGNKDHDPYAPFNLKDLQEKEFDYWALGHIHKREQLSDLPPVVYPGNIQGRHRNESGEKGCYHVQLSFGESKLEFIPLQSILFEEIEIDVSSCKTIYGIEEKLRDRLEGSSCERLIHLTFFSRTDDILTYKNNHILDELIEVINEMLVIEEPWSYIYTYTVKSEEASSFDYDDFFIGEIIHSIKELQVPETVKDLYNHPTARKFLNEYEGESLKRSAKQYLIHELLKVEEGD